MRRLIGALVLLAACAAGPARAESRPAPRRAASPIPVASTQLVLVAVDDWEDVTAELTRYQREPGGPWKPVGERWPAAIGAGGSAWGRGLHGRGAPARRGGPVKREGDGKSPAGAFALGRSFGYAARALPGARVPYVQVDGSWVCVDDPRSAHYNRVLDADRVAADWSSFESMRRHDELYRWVLVIDHNPDASAGGGSCIFLHLWAGRGAGTAGCTAMDREAMEALLAWLDPSARPVFVLLPARELAALRAAWALP